MSEFDKEAEREKLRKQFAEDEQDRAETERMSELLLQGATMTNKHCETCGSPIFRQNGTAFCPTCGADGRTAQAQAESAEAQRAQGAQEASDRSTGEPTATGTEADAPSGHEPARNPSVSGPASGTSAPDTPTPAEDGTDLGAARESLVRTLTTFARRAETAENPGHARELLATVREAAETLDAVDRVRRNH